MVGWSMSNIEIVETITGFYMIGLILWVLAIGSNPYLFVGLILLIALKLLVVFLEEYK